MKSRFILEDEEIIILDEKVANGGPGSGNFGHAGRKGKVGGSAPSGSKIAVSEQRVSSKWIEENRDYLKASGYEDDEIDRLLKGQKWEELKRKAEKAKTVKKFDDIVEEMKREGVLDATWWDDVGKYWWENVGERTRESIKRAEQRKKEAVTPEQGKAIDSLLGDTGIKMNPADERWLRGNVPEQMVKAIHEEIDKAYEQGFSKGNLRLQFTEAERRGGSCTLDKDRETVLIRLTKGDLSDTESFLKKTNREGIDGERWWTCKSGNLGSAMVHELGHGLVWQAVTNQNKSIYDYKRACDTIVYEAKREYLGLKKRDAVYSSADMSEAQKTKAAELRENKDYMLISEYGLTNSAELIAESHANPDYSEFTKIVEKKLNEAIKGDLQL